MNTTLTRALAYATLLAITILLAATAMGMPGDVEPIAVLVEADTSPTAREVVEAVDGVITEQDANVVAATVPAHAVTELVTNPRVQAVRYNLDSD